MYKYDIKNASLLLLLKTEMNKLEFFIVECTRVISLYTAFNVKNGKLEYNKKEKKRKKGAVTRDRYTQNA